MTPDAIARGTAERPSEDYWMVLAIIQPFRLDAVTLARVVTVRSFSHEVLES